MTARERPFVSALLLLSFRAKRDLHVAARIQILPRGVAQARYREPIPERPRIEHLSDVLAVLHRCHQRVQEIAVFLKADLELALDCIPRARELPGRWPLLGERPNL